MPRDFSKPYTAVELEEAKGFFLSMPSYDAQDESISSSDLADLYTKKMEYERTPEQLTAYKNYWDTHFKGKMPLTEYIKTCESLHNPVALARTRAEVYDRDGDGCISVDEFAEYMKLAKIHNPDLKEVSFDDFVATADTNGDGVVSLDEFADWIQKCLEKRHNGLKPGTKIIQ